MPQNRAGLSRQVPTQAAVRAQGSCRLGGKDWTVGKPHMPLSSFSAEWRSMVPATLQPYPAANPLARIPQKRRYQGLVRAAVLNVSGLSGLVRRGARKGAVRRDGSAVHRTVVGSTLGVALEPGDRLVDSAGVAADRAVDEPGRIVEVLGVGQQIRVLRDRVAGVDTDSLGPPLP